MIGRAPAGALTPPQLFRYPTISDLALQVPASSRVPLEQEPPKGSVTLTPIQRWFFELDLAEPHHWNQAFLFEVAQGCDVSRLEQALRRTVNHHDALRLWYSRGPHWEQSYGPPDRPLTVGKVDLSACSQQELGATIEAAAANLQASLNLAEAPLLRAAFFDCGAGRAGRFLLIIHHLLVDGVSWRILLEDLLAAYENPERDLPARTTSYQYWADRLARHARSETGRGELSGWLSRASGAVALPTDFKGGSNLESEAQIVTSSLSPEETRALVQQVPSAYNSQIDDVLLTALARALVPWTGSDSLIVDVEGHGREALFEDVDLSRTVGWFTTVSPVRLELRRGAGPGETLEFVKEQRRATPNRGIGYGLLRYLGEDPETVKALSEQLRSEVLFNYLGQLDQMVAGSALFRLPENPLVPTAAPAAARPRDRRAHRRRATAVSGHTARSFCGGYSRAAG
jgi:hypothetical protein